MAHILGVKGGSSSSFGGASGVILADGLVVAQTLMCGHCGIHWQTKPGSGNKRGFCNSCVSVVCGAKHCMRYCTPLEARIELTEALAQGNGTVARRLRSNYEEINPL